MSDQVTAEAVTRLVGVEKLGNHYIIAVEFADGTTRNIRLPILAAGQLIQMIHNAALSQNPELPVLTALQFQTHRLQNEGYVLHISTAEAHTILCSATGEAVADLADQLENRERLPLVGWQKDS